MLRKQPKGTKKVSSEQPTKGGWQMDGQKKKKSSGLKNLFRIILLFMAVALIGSSFFIPSGGDIVSINASQKKATNNGKLVHVSGDLYSGDFTDPMFKISSSGLGLNRVVEMYQWVEMEGQYIKEWKSEIVALSEDAGDKKNPPEMPFLSKSWKVEKIELGNFDLSDSIIEKVTNYNKLDLTQTDFGKLNKHGQKAFKLHDGTYFFGVDPENPDVGDLRVRFESANAGTYTILAKQVGGRLEAHRDSGTLIEKVMPGNVSLDSITKGVDVGSGGIMSLALQAGGGAALLLLIITFIFGTKGGAKAQQDTQSNAQEQGQADLEKNNIGDDGSDNNVEDTSMQTPPVTEELPEQMPEDSVDQLKEELPSAAEENRDDIEASPVPSVEDVDIQEEIVSHDHDDIPDSIGAEVTDPAPVEDIVMESQAEDNEALEGIEMVSEDDVVEEVAPEDDTLEFESEDDTAAEGIEMVSEDDVVEEVAPEDNTLEFESEEDEAAEGIEMVSEDDVAEEVAPEDNTLEFESEEDEAVEGIEMVSEDDVAEEVAPEDNTLEFESEDDTAAEGIEMVSEDDVAEEVAPEDNTLEFEAEEDEAAEGIEMVSEDDVAEEVAPEDNTLEFEAEEDEAAEGIEMVSEDDVAEEVAPEDNTLEFESEEDEAAEGIEMVSEDDVAEEVAPEDNTLEFESEEDEAAEGIEMVSEDDVAEEVAPEDNTLEFESEEDEAAEGIEMVSEDDVPELPNPKEFLGNDSIEESTLELDSGNIPDDFDPNAEMEVEPEEVGEIEFDESDEGDSLENKQ